MTTYDSRLAKVEQERDELRERVKVLEDALRDLKAYAFNGNYPNSATPHFNSVMKRVRAALEQKPCSD